MPFSTFFFLPRYAYSLHNFLSYELSSEKRGEPDRSRASATSTLVPSHKSELAFLLRFSTMVAAHTVFVAIQLNEILRMRAIFFSNLRAMYWMYAVWIYSKSTNTTEPRVAAAAHTFKLGALYPYETYFTPQENDISSLALPPPANV